MRALSDSDILWLWEHGRELALARRALLLLELASPGTPGEQLAALSIGQRDGLLLELRELTFGRALDCVTACPRCGERLELALATGDLRLPDAPALGPQRLECDGYEVLFRLPTSRDLLDGPPSREALLEACVLAARSPAGETAASELPPAVVGTVAGRMAELDPQAELTLSLRCPACEHGWDVLFDILSFFWGEICARAPRILGMVHRLALAYGWSEAAILALSPQRRQLYLDLVQA